MVQTIIILALFPGIIDRLHILADVAEARQVFDALLEELNAAYVPLRSKFDVSLVLTASAETLDSIELASILFYAEAEGYYDHSLKTITAAMGPG